ncbi:hypothetical protein [Streptomyces flavidovirens]|uniref:hypothetical protein n=1 Tax=Streptomyces flavidovirens TaxID=67298 RepID=UPI00368F749F
MEAQQDVPDQQEPEESQEAAAPAGDRPARRVRPRGRTTLIIAAAAVLGIVGGTATGYTVQAERPPTPLPALAQTGLAYPAKALPEGKEPEPLSAKDDRRVRTDGDLRKLLVSKPAGARVSDEEWVKDGRADLTSYALDFDSEGYMFGELAAWDFRRFAGTAWEQDANRWVSVRLVQFGAGPVAGAAEHADGQFSYMPDDEEGAGNNGDALKGSGNGRYYVYKVDRKAGYLPGYRARALFQRGDIMADIHVFDTKPISKKDIRVLAERQLGRL